MVRNLQLIDLQCCMKIKRPNEHTMIIILTLKETVTVELVRQEVLILLINQTKLVKFLNLWSRLRNKWLV